jgi:glutamate dehydrogenase (NAD(P)+)
MVVLAVSDSSAAIYDPAGLDVPAVIAYKQRHGRLAGYPDAERIDPEALLTLPCDILAPAALESQITAANAEQIQASIIVEAANGPTSLEADQILADRGVMVIPDILANAGGVTVSYFEWVQGLQCCAWSEQEVQRRLAETMRRAFDAVQKTATDYRLTMRTGALALAVQRVAEATHLRGSL